MNLASWAGRLGDWPATVGLPWEYFAVRGCFLDCRGPLTISPTSSWGFGVRVLTQSHDISGGQVGAVIARGVTVGHKAWIASYCVLAGCNIGDYAVVAAGSVVNGQNVGPGVMVAGNPARVIARWQGGRWVYQGFERELL